MRITDRQHTQAGLPYEACNFTFLCFLTKARIYSKTCMTVMQSTLIILINISIGKQNSIKKEKKKKPE